MNVVVYNDLEKPNIKNEIISKEIICLDCKENCLIDIKNFKINFSECKNNHKYNDILLNNYELTQKIDLNEIICDICNNQNKLILITMNFIYVIIVIKIYVHYVNQFMIKIILL